MQDSVNREEQETLSVEPRFVLHLLTRNDLYVKALDD
jgi:hypothetical protein